MAVAGAAGLQHMGRLGVVPPALTRQGKGEAGVLDRVALQPLANEGESRSPAGEAQGLQGLARRWAELLATASCGARSSPK